MNIDWIQIFITVLIVGFCLFAKKYFRKAFHIWKNQGMKMLLIKSYIFLKNKCIKTEHSQNFSAQETSTLPKDKTVQEILYDQFPKTRPISFIKVNRDDFRINVVTDSLQKENYFGGVATSLILATLFSNKFNIPLRIISRYTSVNPTDFTSFLDLMKITQPRKMEFFSDAHDCHNPAGYKLEVSDNDIFISTSWWSSQAVKSINFRKSFFYILQEVEKFFYPNGDEHCMCEAILEDSEINYIINSKPLYDYYKKFNYKNVMQRSVTFEPAFPDHLYYAEKQAFEKKVKKKLFFYSRPEHKRNLFHTGLKILDEALLSGLIDKEEWEIYFGGSNTIPSVVFSNGLKPIVLGHLDWSKYLDFIKSVDLCVSFIHTPHPSYIPLDAASIGAIVLTNKFETKDSLPYSQNIICENTDHRSLMKGFEKAVKLAQDSEQRYKNFLNNNIEKSWEKSLGHVLNHMYEHK